MIWLATQMWVELLLAIGLGAAIGWWLHQALRASRTDEEGRSLTPPQPQPPPAPSIRASPEPALPPELQPDDATLIAKRRLEARVRFLESQLATMGEGSAVQPPPRAEDALLDPSHRLKWRATYLAGRVRYLEEELSRGARIEPQASPVPAPRPGEWSAAPIAALPGPRDGKADDLKQISGIGPKLEKLLNKLGVYHFDQIADWTQREIDWANQAMTFRGRIEREKWVQQAAELARAARQENTGSEAV
jgi:NADH-quinone oxidoreductase subunit E